MAQDINIKVGANISDLEKKLKQAQKSLQRSGQQMSRIGNDMIMSLSVPIGIFGASIIGAAANFESSMNGMKAVTAGGVDSFEELTAKAKELGATTQFSANQAASAMEMLGRNGLTATQILEGAADASLSLAAATGTDLSNAANIATDAMAQFGLKASDLLKVSDLITGATVNSKFSIDEFQMAMAQAGGVAGAVGVSFEDFAATVAAISPSFASGSDAGTSLKTMLTRLVPEGKPAMEMMKQLGIITASGANQFFDAAGNMKSMSEVAGVLQSSFTGLSEAQTITAAKTLFGTDAMRAGLKMAEVGSSSFDKLSESIAGVSAAEVAAIKMQGFNGAVLKLKSAFETLQLAIADSGVLDFATRMVEGLTSMSLSLATLDPAVLKVGTGFLLLVAAIGPAIKLMGMMQLVQASMAGNVAKLVVSYGYLTAAVRFYTSAEGRALIVQNIKTGAMKLYNMALVASRAILSGLAMTMNLFRISTYKNIAATVGSTAALVANKLATVGVNVAAFAGVAIINTVIAAETAYMAIKSLLTGKIKIAAAAQMLFNAVLTANPIGLVVVAIAALVAAFVFAYQNIEWFRKGVDNAMKFIKNVVSAAIAGVGQIMRNIPAFLSGVMAAFSQMFANLQNGFSRFLLTAEIFSEKFKRALTIDGDVRAEITKTIAGLEKQKKKLVKTGTTLGEAYNKAFNAELAKNKKVTVTVEATVVSAAPVIAPVVTPTSTASGGGSSAENIGKTTNALKLQRDELFKNATALTALTTLQVESDAMGKLMTVTTNSLTAARAQAGIETQRLSDITYSFNESLTNLVNTGLADLATGLGEGIGGMIDGTANMEMMAGTLLSTIGGLLMQLGQLAIQTGIAISGIQVALSSLNPVVAIAAGVALVALATLVKGKAAKISESGSSKIPAFAKGGVVDKPTYGVFGEAGPEVIVPKKRLDTYLSKMSGGGGGGSESLSARISGNDLLILLDKAKVRNGRV